MRLVTDGLVIEARPNRKPDRERRRDQGGDERQGKRPGQLREMVQSQRRRGATENEPNPDGYPALPELANRSAVPEDRVGRFVPALGVDQPTPDLVSARPRRVVVEREPAQAVD